VRLRKRVARLLDPGQGGRWAERLDLVIMGLIGASVLAVMLETVPALADRFGAAFSWFEVAAVAVFTVEYLARLWTAVEHGEGERPVVDRVRHAASFFMLVDLAAILPFYLRFFVGDVLDLRFLRILRFLRFLRVLKLARYSDAMRSLLRVARKKREPLILSMAINGVIVVAAASLMYFVENPAQPEVFRSIPHSLYWALVTLTTVGYGDVVPVTTVGRFLAVTVAFFGIGMVALPASILAGAFTEEALAEDRGEDARDEDAEALEEPNYCPRCGLDLDGG
jgi:voltage-gated potassium channel